MPKKNEVTDTVPERIPGTRKARVPNPLRDKQDAELQAIVRETNGIVAEAQKRRALAVAELTRRVSARVRAELKESTK